MNKCAETLYGTDRVSGVTEPDQMFTNASDVRTAFSYVSLLALNTLDSGLN